MVLAPSSPKQSCPVFYVDVVRTGEWAGNRNSRIREMSMQECKNSHYPILSGRLSRVLFGIHLIEPGAMQDEMRSYVCVFHIFSFVKDKDRPSTFQYELRQWCRILVSSIFVFFFPPLCLAGALKLVSHPNVVRLEAVHEDPRSISIVMTLCRGGDLWDKVSRKVCEVRRWPLGCVTCHHLLSVFYPAEALHCDNTGTTYRQPQNL